MSAVDDDMVVIDNVRYRRDEVKLFGKTERLAEIEAEAAAAVVEAEIAAAKAAARAQAAADKKAAADQAAAEKAAADQAAAERQTPGDVPDGQTAAPDGAQESTDTTGTKAATPRNKQGAAANKGA